MDQVTAPLSASTKRAIVYLALIQGVLLLLIHEALARDLWLGTHVGIRTLWYTIALALPSAGYLLIRDVRDRRLWLMLAAYAVVLVAGALYTGSLYVPEHHLEPGPLFIPYALSQAAVWFVVLFLMEITLEGGHVWHTRHDVCTYAWRHFLTLALLALFLLLTYALLLLWGALFKVLHIDFFSELFENRRFIYPVFGLMGGIGVVILRGQAGVVSVMERIANALMAVLLPLAAVIIILFLAALPFTGIQPLWQTRNATALMMWLISLTLLFVNVVYNGRAERYPLWWRVPVLLAIAVLPAYAALSAWSMGLRIAQYGWSLERLWAATVLSIQCAFILPYAYAVVRRRAAWHEWLSKMNKAAGISAALLLLVIHSPLLDFHRIAADDQAARLAGGKVKPGDFDFTYLRFDLGEYGYRKTQELSRSPLVARDPTLADYLGKLLDSTMPWETVLHNTPRSTEELTATFNPYPPGEPVPPELIRAITADPTLSGCRSPSDNCALVHANLTGESAPEYVFMNRYGLGAEIFQYLDGKWTHTAQIVVPYEDREAFKKALESGKVQAVKSRYPDLSVGTRRYQIVAEQQGPGH